MLSAVLAACEGDGGVPDITADGPTTAGPTTSAPTTTAAPATTTTTTPATTTATSAPPTTETTVADLPFDTHEVKATDLCVIGLGFGGTFNVRSGPSPDYAVVGTLPYGQSGVEATGLGAFDADGDEWKQIMFEGEPQWAAAHYLTPDTCTVGTPAGYCVIDQPCGGGLNIRAGVSVDYDVIGEFLASDGNVPGTGVTALDDQGRTWTQVEWAGDVGWSAGWLLQPQPCTPLNCTWIITARSIGNVRIGMSPTQAVATGHIEGPDHTPNCGRGEAMGPYAANAFQGTYDGDTNPAVELVTVWVRSANFQTPQGMGIGNTRAEIIAAMGQPTEETTLFYSGWDMIYDQGPYSLAFHLPSQTEPVWDITIGYGWAVRTLWDC